MAAAICAIGLLFLAGCTCGRPFNPPPPRPGQPAAGAFGGDPSRFAPANLDPEKRKQCIDTCKTFCRRAQECNVPKLEQPAVCGRICWFLCARDVLDQDLRGCVKVDSDCPTVVRCAEKIGEKVAKLRAEQGATPAPPAPPAAPGVAPAAAAVAPSAPPSAPPAAAPVAPPAAAPPAPPKPAPAPATK
jgi:hypothetical protein